MIKNTGHRKLGKTGSHRRAMLKNMAVSVIMHEEIQTTVPKAKELRRVVEGEGIKLISYRVLRDAMRKRD